MENMSHQWAFLSLDHLLPLFLSLLSSPLVSLSVDESGGLALAFRHMSLHPLFSFPVHMLSRRQAEVH